MENKIVATEKIEAGKPVVLGVNARAVESVKAVLVFDDGSTRNVIVDDNVTEYVYKDNIPCGTLTMLKSQQRYDKYTFKKLGTNKDGTAIFTVDSLRKNTSDFDEVLKSYYPDRGGMCFDRMIINYDMNKQF